MMKIINLGSRLYFNNEPNVFLIFPVTPGIFYMSLKKLYYLRWHKKWPLKKFTFGVLLFFNVTRYFQLTSIYDRLVM